MRWLQLLQFFFWFTEYYYSWNHSNIAFHVSQSYESCSLLRQSAICWISLVKGIIMNFTATFFQFIFIPKSVFSMDVYVLFSSNLLIHLVSLCSLSLFTHSYYAIVRPLEYPLYMTNRTVFFMLTNVWLLPALISFTPIFLGWYTTGDALKAQRENPNVCEFVANKTYAIISSLVSFWIPGLVMITMYCRIYR